MAPGFLQLVEQYRDERVIGPGERDAVIIEHALPRQRAHAVGQGVVGDGARLCREITGQICRLCAVRHIAVHETSSSSGPYRPRGSVPMRQSYFVMAGL